MPEEQVNPKLKQVILEHLGLDEFSDIPLGTCEARSESARRDAHEENADCVNWKPNGETRQVETVTLDATFADRLGASSLDKLECLMAIEEAFDLEIPDEDGEKLRTVQDVQEYLVSHGVKL